MFLHLSAGLCLLLNEKLMKYIYNKKVLNQKGKQPTHDLLLFGCVRGLPRIHLRGPWCTGCYRRTSPRRWRPGSAAPCRSCRWWHRATPQTGGSCRWSFAWPRPSVVWGRSSAPCLSSFRPRQRRRTVRRQASRGDRWGTQTGIYVLIWAPDEWISTRRGWRNNADDRWSHT